MNRCMAIITTGLVMVGFHGIVSAATIELGADADAFVERTNGSGHTNWNFGADEKLLVKNHNGSSWSRLSYLRFDLGTFEENAELADASLTLTPIESGKGTESRNADWTFSVYGVNETPSGSAWEEGTGTIASHATDGITFNSAPANAGNGYVELDQVSLLGTFDLTGKGTGQTVDISGQTLVDFILADTDDSVTMIIARDTLPGQNYVHAFASREYTPDLSADAPTLSLALTGGTAPVPEPVTIVLLGVGMTPMLLRRGRH